LLSRAPFVSRAINFFSRDIHALSLLCSAASLYLPECYALKNKTAGVCEFPASFVHKLQLDEVTFIAARVKFITLRWPQISKLCGARGGDATP